MFHTPHLSPPLARLNRNAFHPGTRMSVVLTRKVKTALGPSAWQNQQMSCTPIEDSCQLWHPPSVIRTLAVRMRKA